MRKEERRGVREDSNEMLELLSPGMRQLENHLEEGMQPITEFLPGESHGQRNLEGYSPWDGKELDTTEVN